MTVRHSAQKNTSVAATDKTIDKYVPKDEENDKKHYRGVMLASFGGFMSSTKLLVLVVLCLQNSLFTVLRRYSQGVLKETYSKYEVLLFGEIVKMIFSIYMISDQFQKPTSLPLSPSPAAASHGSSRNENNNDGHASLSANTLRKHVLYLIKSSSKMAVLAIIYGLMNILSFVALRNIGAGTFTICAQLKILTTATCSSIMLRRRYSWVKWRALLALLLGVLLFSENVWNKADEEQEQETSKGGGGNAILGTVAVLTEVTLSGFASIYFEKVIKTDSEQLNIWERNFQLAFGSCPIYVAFILFIKGGKVGYFGGWSLVAFVLAMLGAAGGLLVALSIKYADAILKTLATTGSIILSSLLEKWFLKGPLTPVMSLAGGVVIIAICDYTFDPSPPAAETKSVSSVTLVPILDEDEANDEKDNEMNSLLSIDDAGKFSKTG